MEEILMNDLEKAYQEINIDTYWRDEGDHVLLYYQNGLIPYSWRANWREHRLAGICFLSGDVIKNLKYKKDLDKLLLIKIKWDCCRLVNELIETNTIHC